ncbi:sensor histidine kinase [Sphingomonas paucimobilis]|uniref:sensor histidine kinase n=1 Tax=Sphingomonas paucimobilis TaxID=13689 RepID=UPI0030F61B03
MIARSRSLLTRILLVELGAIALAALALPTIMASMLHQTMAHFQRETLTAQARAIAGAFHRSPGGAEHLQLGRELAAEYDNAYDGRAFLVIRSNGQVLARSRYADPAVATHLPGGTGVRDIAFGRIVGVILPLIAPRDGAVVVTQDESGPGAIVDDVVVRFQRRYTTVLVGLLLLLPVLNLALVRQLLVSVRRISARAGVIEAQTLDQRLDERGVPSEVAPLVNATNRLIGRLEQSFAEQAEFVANVAHELRTPIATLRMQIEPIPTGDLRDRLSASAARLTHVVAQLQDLASLERMSRKHLERFDLCATTRDVVEELAPAVINGGRTINLEVSAGPIELLGSVLLTSLAVTNLIDNAAKHTPPGTSIEVIVERPGSVSVIDDGPGISAEHAGSAAKRFWRADHRRTDSAGLGLAIVTRIMQVHEGALEIGVSDPGGTRAVLRFA